VNVSLLSFWEFIYLFIQGSKRAALSDGPGALVGQICVSTYMYINPNNPKTDKRFGKTKSRGKGIWFETEQTDNKNQYLY